MIPSTTHRAHLLLLMRESKNLKSNSSSCVVSLRDKPSSCCVKCASPLPQHRRVPGTRTHHHTSRLFNNLNTTQSNIFTLYYMLYLFHNILETGRTLETNTTIEVCINTLINFSLGKERRKKIDISK